MKKLIGLGIASIMCVSLVACGGDTSAGTPGAAAEPMIPDLTGEWKQVNSNSEDSCSLQLLTKAQLPCIGFLIMVIPSLCIGLEHIPHQQMRMSRILGILKMIQRKLLLPF